MCYFINPINCRISAPVHYLAYTCTNKDYNSFSLSFSSPVILFFYLFNLTKFKESKGQSFQGQTAKETKDAGRQAGDHTRHSRESRARSGGRRRGDHRRARSR